MVYRFGFHKVPLIRRQSVRIEEVEVHPLEICKVSLKLLLFKLVDPAAKEPNLHSFLGINRLIDLRVGCRQWYKGLKSNVVEEGNKNMLIVADFQEKDAGP